MKWIKHDRENRNKYLPDLMKYVRLPIISQAFLESTVDKELLLEFNKNSNYIIYFFKFCPFRKINVGR